MSDWFSTWGAAALKKYNFTALNVVIEGHLAQWVIKGAHNKSYFQDSSGATYYESLNKWETHFVSELLVLGSSCNSPNFPGAYSFV